MTRGKPLSFDRKEALKSAMELFWSHGYEATGMTQLLEHMGIPRQSFYNTFGSKEEILFEAIQMYSDSIRQMLREVLEGAEAPFEKIDRIFAMWEEMNSQNNGTGCFLGNCVAEFGKTHDKVAAMMADKLQSIHGVFAGIFQEAIDRGDLPADRSADIMAGTMMTYSQGLALLSKTTTDKSQRQGTMDIMKRSLKH
jgi:TetR/AcrR family transcriptional repressor of nem operon